MGDVTSPSELNQGCGIQAFAGSHDISIGSFSATTVGRDLNVTYVTNYFGAEKGPPVSDKEGVQEQRSVIMAALNAPNFRAIYQQALQQRMKGTGVWFLEMREFKKFLEEKGVILWCTGMPGAGKTILASIAVEHLEMAAGDSKCTAVAFAFIRYSEKRTLRDILSSLLCQLVEGNDTACTVAWSFYSKATAKTGAQFLESDMVATLLKIIQVLDMVYFLIDGLDEASDELKDSLLEFLAASGANILLLSRPLDLFVHHMPAALSLSIQARTEDIGLYVADQVKRSSRLKALLHGKPELVKELSKAIKEKASGMFLLARLQMQSVITGCVSVNGLLQALEKLPSGIEEMYGVTMERINSQPEADVSIAHRVFAFLLHSDPHLGTGNRVMMYADDIEQFLAVTFEREAFDENDISPLSLILSSCGGLLSTIETEQGAVVLHFIHYTTQEYLQRAHLSMIPVDYGTFFAVTFAIYVETHLKSLLAIQGTDSKQLRHYFSRHQFLHLCIRKWGYHAALSQSHQLGVLHPFIHSFLARHPVYPFIYGTSYLSVEWLPGLHLAAVYGLVEVIVRKNLPCYALYSHNAYTPFHFAAEGGHFDVFRALASNYPGIDARTKGGRTFLHIAVRHNNTSFLEALWSWIDSLSAEELCLRIPTFDINAQDEDGMTPLLEAVQVGNGDMALTMISRPDVQASIQNNEGVGVFYLACQSYGRTIDKFTEHLISSFPELTIHAPSVRGRTAFMEACEKGKEHICRLILGQDSTVVHHADLAGTTPLMCATYLLNEPILRLLLDNGADPHAVDKHLGLSAFLHTVKTYTPDDKAQQTILQLFLRYDHNCILHRDRKGQTALMHTANNRTGLPTLALLLSHSEGTAADVNCQDRDGMTVLMHAFQPFADALNDFVVTYDAAIDVDLHPKSRGDTLSYRQRRLDNKLELLIIRSLSNHRRCHDIINFLVRVPYLDVNLRDRRGRSALDWACSLGGPPLLKQSYQAFQSILQRQDDMFREFGCMVNMFFTTLEVLANPPTHCWRPQALRRAVITGTCALADVVLCSFLRQPWVIQAFAWTLDEEDGITLLAHASNRKCRVAAGIILTYLGLLGREGRQELWPGMAEVDIAEGFCGLGCEWHSDYESDEYD
ncbi:hypothetical protein NMY22_g3407 [Coprinellus aureogranulatus]|nr:hypothetical protein NMY22_g3407 [Coprinellus aureogranulatus]